MNKKRTTLIGAFLIGAIVISAVGMALFFGGSLGQSKTRAVMVFRGNVTGLEVGTPVQFRGMKIGEVKRVRTVYQPDSKAVLFPVYAEFTGKIEIPGYERTADKDGVRAAWINAMVERGLRAQLQTKSFVTGQQMIMLDFVDDNEAVLSKIEPELLEIPTVRSPNETLVDSFRELPVREIVAQVQTLVANMNKLMVASDGAPGVLPQTLRDIAQLAQALGQQTPRLTNELSLTGKEVRETLGVARQSLLQLNQTVASVQTQLDQIAPDVQAGLKEVRQLGQQAQAGLAAFEGSLRRAEGTLNRMDTSLQQLDFVLSEDAPLGAGLSSTLKQIEEASRSLRYATDRWQRQPNSILFGSPGTSP
jgi:paraquat-inducible protein B